MAEIDNLQNAAANSQEEDGERNAYSVNVGHSNVRSVANGLITVCMGT